MSYLLKNKPVLQVPSNTTVMRKNMVFLCLLGFLSGNVAMVTQEVKALKDKGREPGFPVTNESVEAGLRKNREALRQALQFQSHDAPTHLRLAEVLSQQGDPNGAIEEYQAAIQLNSGMAEAFRGLGAVFIDKHEWEKAEQSLRKGTALKPQDHLAFYWLGRTLIAQALFSQAQEALITATQLDPINPEAQSDLALTFMAQGLTEEAEEALKKAISLQPDFAEAHHRLEQVRAANANPLKLIQSAQLILQALFRRE